MARHYKLDDKKFRGALRKENFPWHEHGARWKPQNRDECEDMIRVAKRLKETGK